MQIWDFIPRLELCPLYGVSLLREVLLYSLSHASAALLKDRLASSVNKTQKQYSRAVLAEHAWNKHHQDRASIFTSESNDEYCRLILESCYIHGNHRVYITVRMVDLQLSTLF